MDFGSNGSALYVQGRPASRPSHGFSDDNNERKMANIPDGSNGSVQYTRGRVGSDPSDEGDEYEKGPATEDDIVCDSCGLLRDRHGYLILSNNMLGRHAEPTYYKPVPPPRQDVTEEYESLPHKRCSRPLWIALICMAVLFLGSLGANAYLSLHYRFVSSKSSSTNDIAVYMKQQPVCCVEYWYEKAGIHMAKANDETGFKFEPPVCPRSVTYQVGYKATISCSLQIPTPTSRPTVDIYLIDDYEGNRQTLLSQEQIPENGTLVKKSEVFNASMEVSVDGNGLMLIDVSYESIKCCYQGNLWISISGHLMVQIEVHVTADVQCQTNTQHTVNTVNYLSCTRCICGKSTSSQLPIGSWIYNHDDSSNVTQPGRVTFDQVFDEKTDLITYILVFNETACFDGGEYTLVLTNADTTYSQLNFTLQISGATFGPRATSTTINLLTQNHVTDLEALCISNSQHDAFISNHSVTYTFFGDDASLEILQAENSSVVSNERSATIGFIPASQQSVNIATYRGNSIQFRPAYGNGILNMVVIFDSVQCFHSGYYQFYVDNVLLHNLTVSVDDTQERTVTTIYQKGEDTGFVETFNITMECAATVGCTKRPFVIDKEIQDANTTFKYSLEDRNSDNIKDFFIATITSNVLDIPMTLNNTDFTCSVTSDAMTQAMTYTIYVLEATFCDTRPVNCEYFYPYRMVSTCKHWVSCLNDRPRVKMCSFNLYYNKNDGQCSGQCDYECPWNL